MDIISKFTHALSVFGLLLGLIACADSDSGNGKSSPETTNQEEADHPPPSGGSVNDGGKIYSVAIVGKVVDGPVIDAAIQLRDPATDQLLKIDQATLPPTVSTGGFDAAFELPADLVGKPLLIETSGGTDMGADSRYNAATDRAAFPMSGIVSYEENNFESQVSNNTLHQLQNVVISPITTLLAKKVKRHEGTQRALATQEVSSQIGLASDEIFSDPMQHAKTAQVASSIAMAVLLLEKVNQTQGSLSANAVLEQLATSQKALISVTSGSNGVVLKTDAILSAIQTGIPEISTANLTKSRLILESSTETISRLAQQTANQATAAVQLNSNTEKRAIISFETGINGLLTVAEVFEDVADAGNTSEFELTLLANAFATSVKDRIVQESQKSASAFEPFAYDDLNAEALQATVQPIQVTWVKDTFLTLFEDSTSIAGKAASALSENNLSGDSALSLQVQALNQALAKMSSELTTLQNTLPDNDLNAMVNVVSTLIEVSIDNNFVSQLKTKSDGLPNQQDSSFSDVAWLASVSVAQNLFDFVQTTITTDQFTTLKEEAQVSTGTLFNNALTESTQTALSLVDKIVELESDSSTSGILDNLAAAEALASSTNLDTAVEDVQTVIEEESPFVEEISSNRVCTSIAGGSLLGDGGSVFNEVQCGNRDNQYTISTSHVVTWNGEQSPLLGNVTVQPGGSFQVDTATNSVVFGDVTLLGGTLSIQTDTIISGRLTLGGDATLKIAPNATLTYSGDALDIQSHTLTVSGGGRLKNLNPLILSSHASALVLTSTGTAIDTVNVLGTESIPTTITVQKSATITSLSLNQNTNLDLLSEQSLTIDTLTILSDLELSVNGISSLKQLNLQASLSLTGTLPSTESASLAVTQDATLGFEGAFDFSGGFTVAPNTTLTLDNQQAEVVGAITVATDTVEGFVVSSEDDKVIFGPAPKFEASLSFDPVGTLLFDSATTTKLTITATFNRPVLSTVSPKIDIHGANNLQGGEMTQQSSTEYTYVHTLEQGSGLAYVTFVAGEDLLGNTVETTPSGNNSFTINNRPTGILLSSQTVAENSAIGTTVGLLDVNDVDGNDTSTFQLIAGANDTDNELFSIDGNQLKTAVVFDYETQTTFQIRVQGADGNGGSVEETFIIQIEDVDDNSPQVTSLTSTNGLYKVGDIIAIQMIFDEVVYVSGTPTLILQTGGNQRDASYISGSDSQTLIFQYVVKAGDNTSDLATIDTEALQLNGGSIRDQANNEALLTLPIGGSGGALQDTSNVVLDTKGPSVVTISAATTDGSYSTGATLSLVLEFDDQITVNATSGFPTLTLEMGEVDQNAIFTNFSGGTTLTFSYTVQAGDTSADLGYHSTTALALNGAIIQDMAGNTAVDSPPLPIPGAANSLSGNADIVVDTTAPTVTEVQLPRDGSYKAGQALDFVVNFSEVATVTGSPQLSIMIGSSTKLADYVSGTGTLQLAFSYTIDAGDTDSNGIELDANSLMLNNGSILDQAGNDAVLTLNSIPSSTVKVDTTIPSITNVSVPPSAAYKAGQILDFTVTFSEIIIVTGSPQLPLTVGSAARFAQYQSGSGGTELVFRYQVASGDTDDDGVDVSNTLDLNAGTLQDLAGNDAPLSIDTFLNNLSSFQILIDTTVPTISNVQVPTDGKYKVGQVLEFTVTASEPVNVTSVPQLSVVIGINTQKAQYVAGSGSSTLVFRYTVVAGDSDNDGIEIGAALELGESTIQDSAQNDVVLTLNNVPLTNAVLVDTIAPSITEVSVPSDGSYKAGQTVDFQLIFSENVIVTDTPQLGLTIGNSNKWADYLSGSGSTQLIFRYTVVAGDNDNDGIQVKSLSLNTGSLVDSAGNDASLALNNIGATEAVLIDTTSPFVSGVAVPASGNYKAGQTLDYTINVSEVVSVFGVPQLPIVIGTETRQASYLSGSGSAELVFRYTLVGGDTGAVSPHSDRVVALNSGAIQDKGGNEIDLKLNNIGSSTISIDTTAPTVSSVSVPISGSYKAGQTLDFTVNMAEAVVVTGVPQLSLTIGSSTKRANYLSGSGSTALVFRYTVVSGDTDADGIVLDALTPNNGTIQDGATNDTTLALNGVAATDSILIDTTAPNTSLVTVPSDGTYSAGQHLDFMVTYSETVQVAGIPYLALTLGDATKQAQYLSGSGSTDLVFRYTVVSGDRDSDGIAIDSLELNNGTIHDTAENAASVVLNGLPSTKAILVETD